MPWTDATPSWAELARDAGDDPFLQLCADPTFAGALEAAERDWAAEAPYVDAVCIAPDDHDDDHHDDDHHEQDLPRSGRELLTDAGGADWARRAVLLEQIDPATLDGGEAEEYARLYAALAARVAYRQIGARLAVAARCRSAKKGGADFAGTSLAVAEKVSPATAEIRLANARQMVERLPDLVALLGAGEVSAAHLSKVLEATSTLSPEQCLVVRAEIADRAAHVAPGQLGKAARRAAAAIDPEDFTRRQNRARSARTAYVRPGEDGMAFLGIIGPAEQIALAHLSVDEAARALRAAGDPRSLAQLRCDLALDRLQDIHCGPAVAGPPSRDADDAPRLPDRTKHGRPVRVVVHVELPTLLGVDDTPGEVTGIGPIPAHVARELATTSNDWWRMVLDPGSGVCRDYGRLKKPGQDLTDLIVARDAACMAPMCDEDIDDLDHGRERRAGGLTTDDNLEGLSAHCHTVKTDGGWQPRIHPDGSVTWTSPHGREHTVRAKDHRLRPRPARSYQPLDPSTMPAGSPLRHALEEHLRKLAKHRPAPVPRPPLPADGGPPF